jgi:N-acetylmuramoyl-L-alanine amidase
VAKLSTEPARVRPRRADERSSFGAGAAASDGLSIHLAQSPDAAPGNTSPGKGVQIAQEDEGRRIADAMRKRKCRTPPIRTSDGQRSLVRALGLKVGRIVIDAGHGGHDSGTLGPGGIEEKDVVLDVALRVGKLLHQRLGAEIVYTRSDDTFIPLETRTAIANKAQADLFLSIHANSSPEPRRAAWRPTT